MGFAVTVAERYLETKTDGQHGRGWIEIDGQRLTDFHDLVSHITHNTHALLGRPGAPPRHAGGFPPPPPPRRRGARPSHPPHRHGGGRGALPHRLAGGA